MQHIEERIERATAAIWQEIGPHWLPQVAVILGSGFANWVSTLDIQHQIRYQDIQGYPKTTVQGHAGTLIAAEVRGIRTLIMNGRFHFYEGHEMSELSIPIRVFHQLGARKLFLTNAAGGINEHFAPGDLMVITDHINLLSQNPLIGPNLDHYGVRFPDASKIYTPSLRQTAFEISRAMALPLQKGTYLYTSGPSFETPAEIRMMRTLGADVVGMSTVPEALVANHAGMQVFGLSLVANLAAGMSDTELTHQEVMATMDKVAVKANTFITAMIERMLE